MCRSPRAADERVPLCSGRSPDIQRARAGPFLSHRRNAPAQDAKRQLAQKNSEMTTITRTFTRYFALPIVSAGIIGGAALGMAGMANAATPTEPSGPGHSSAPSFQAHPAPEAVPGWHGHHGVNHIEHLDPGYHR